MHRPLRLLLRALLPLLGLAAVLAAAVLASLQSGRTPAELLGMAQRLAQHEAPALADATGPLLAALGQGLAAQAAGGPPPPFQVPPLPPNPAAAATQATAGGGAPPPAADLRAAAAPSAALPGGGRLLQVGPGRALTTVRSAAAAARDGDTIEIDPGDYLGDVAVWTQSDITIRGLRQGAARVRLIAQGASAEGKAIWVLRGGRITVEGIDFIGSRVADRNGAGIRFERGHLLLRRCLFFDNQNGVLASPHPQSVLEIEQSEFGYNGHGDGYSHALYTDRIALLKVTASHFHHANVGHLIKSRAARSLIAYNRLADDAGGRASYELEFPNGGQADVWGNLVQQGPQTQNSALVSFGAEGALWPRSRLRLAFNTLVNGHPHGGSFVRAAPGAELVLLLNNLLVGRGVLDLPADAVQQRNPRRPLDDFAGPAQQDWRLLPGPWQALAGMGLADTDAELLPRAQYQHPLQLQPLDEAPRVPGAQQQPAR